VHYKDGTIQREDLRMAYMDVARTGPANGRSVLLRLGTAIALLPPKSAFPQRTCRHSQAGGVPVLASAVLRLGRRVVAVAPALLVAIARHERSLA
jgi:hypothetical protein